MERDERDQVLELTAEIVAAYVSNNPIAATEISALISDIHAALMRVAGAPSDRALIGLQPAIPVQESVTPDYIVCLDDGKKFKSLKRHLNNEHGMSPDEYRAKWGLNKDYPMVAPNYSASRSSLARTMGLGRKAAPQAAEAPAPAEAPAKRGRRSKATA